ncbi:MAG: arginine deiminase family protein [Acidobacteriota bacterium]|nr:arginine deiminase family protein [Acidobacteriota bacterium]
MTDVGPWAHLLVRHAREAFASDATIAREWRALNFTAAPDWRLAVEQYERFLDLLTGSGAAVVSCASQSEHLTLDSIYVRDASVMCAAGAILCRMGKPPRAAEPAALADTYRALGVPIVGAIEAPGRLEGGDVTWLGPRLAAVGRGYRTNDEGIRQLRVLLGDTIDELVVVPLPHYRGPGDVFHLMSIISPVDRDLAVVYSPLMPVPFRERLLDQGYRLVEVPDHEFASMGANVFALSPGRALMVAGNPDTRAALERAGAEVLVYDGSEISLKGGGGPTCLTRPLLGFRKAD